MSDRAAWIGLVAATVLLHAGAARASDDFADALRTACTEAQAMTDARLLDAARATYVSLGRTAPGERCGTERVRELLGVVQTAARRRARAIEAARLSRLAGHRERALAQYVSGLTIDPVADGARAGLRLVLAQPMRGDHCERAQQLLGARLLWEARLEVARAERLHASCTTVRKTLVDVRVRAYARVHRALAAERAGDGDRARALFIDALAADPGAHAARAGLRRISPPLPTTAARPEVVTRLEVGGSCTGGGASSGPRPAVVSRVTVRVAAGDPDVGAMRADRGRGSAFRDARNSLIERVGLPPPKRRLTHRGYNAQDHEGIVDVDIEKGIAVVTFTVGGVINERRLQEEWPWIIRPAHPGVTVRPAIRRAPPGSKRRVEVVACGWRPVDAGPVPPSEHAPSHGDRSSLTWDLAARPLGPRPQVTLEAPLLDRWSLASSSPAAVIRSFGAVLVPIVLFLLAVALLPAGSAPRLRAAAGLGLFTAFAFVGSLVLLFDSDPNATAIRLLIGLVPLTAVLVFFFALAPPQARFARAGVGCGAALSVAVVVWTALEPSWLDVPHGVILALAVVLVATLSYALLTVAAEGLALGLDSARSSWPRLWRVLLGLLIAAAVVAQALQFVWQRRTGWYELSVVFEGDDPVLPNWLDGVDFGVMYQPFDTLGAGILLLAPAAAGLALTALRLRRAPEPLRATFGDRWAGRLVAVLFVAVAVGTSAPVLGFPLPIAFGVGVVYLWLIRSRVVPAAETYARQQAGRQENEDSLLSLEREQLRQRAAAVHRQQRIEDDLLTKYAAGDEKSTETALDTALTAARARTTQLQHGDPNEATPPPLSVLLPEEAPPEAVALSLGPAGDWWVNGRRAVRLSLPLAVFIPVGFSIGVLVGNIIDRGALALLANAPVGIVASIATEILFWVASAFSLGALLAHLPGRNAPMKGLALASAYVVPLALLHLGNEAVDGLTHIGRPFHLAFSDWLFRGFELGLFMAFVGFRVDAESVKDSVARLVPLYGLDDFRNTVVYIAPVVLTLVLVGAQLFRGDASNAIETILENAGSIVPGGGALSGLGR